MFENTAKNVSIKNINIYMFIIMQITKILFNKLIIIPILIIYTIFYEYVINKYVDIRKYLIDKYNKYIEYLNQYDDIETLNKKLSNIEDQLQTLNTNQTKNQNLDLLNTRKINNIENKMDTILKSIYGIFEFQLDNMNILIDKNNRILQQYIDYLSEKKSDINKLVNVLDDIGVKKSFRKLSKTLDLPKYVIKRLDNLDFSKHKSERNATTTTAAAATTTTAAAITDLTNCQINRTEDNSNVLFMDLLVKKNRYLRYRLDKILSDRDLDQTDFDEHIVNTNIKLNHIYNIIDDFIYQLRQLPQKYLNIDLDKIIDIYQIINVVIKLMIKINESSSTVGDIQSNHNGFFDLVEKSKSIEPVTKTQSKSVTSSPQTNMSSIESMTSGGQESSSTMVNV